MFTFVVRRNKIELWIDDSSQQTSPQLFGKFDPRELSNAVLDGIRSIDRRSYSELWPTHDYPAEAEVS